ncbi:unnamed protein product [Rodentolepis nana]|uniref:tRNA (guanine(46)-N(7))-methyltransferase n=1 Tax=Rodentolepis nana TaxID=102285 RepID=A0A0R3TBZ5_RODNA|nr:unnamed protein product [Rodentolepis nana]
MTSEVENQEIAKLPQKRLYRQRAHCNPWADHSLNYPTRPDLFQWGVLFDGKEEPPVTMVDIGCGYGGLLFSLSTRFPTSRIVGMEIRLKVMDYVQVSGQIEGRYLTCPSWLL